MQFGVADRQEGPAVSVGLWGALLYVQWTGYVSVVWGSGQTGRTGGKCWFVRSFTVCTVDGVRACSLG